MSAGYHSYCVCFLMCTCLSACACVFTYILFRHVRGVFCVCALTCAHLRACVQLLSGRVATELASFVNKLPAFLGRASQGSAYPQAVRTATL